MHKGMQYDPIQGQGQGYIHTSPQGLNYFQRGVGALPIQWSVVEICELRCNAKICDFMQVIIAVI